MDIEITVARREPSPGDKKPGIIYDQTGKRWGCFPPLWNQLYEGGTFVVKHYTTFQGQNGQTYYTIKDAQPATGMAQSNQQYNGQRSPPPARPMTPPPDDNTRRLDIFMAVSWRAFMERVDDPANMRLVEMVDQLHKFKSAWLAVFGPSPLPRQQVQKQDSISSGPQNADIDDEIPF